MSTIIDWLERAVRAQNKKLRQKEAFLQVMDQDEVQKGKLKSTAI